MAQGVGGDVFGDAGHTGVFLDDALDGAGGEAAEIAGGVDSLLVLAIIEEKRVERIGAGVQIVADAVGGGFGDEDGAVFAAFATNHKLATVEIDGVAVELGELGDAEAARKEKFDNSAIAETGFGGGVDLVEEFFDFVIVEEGNLFADDVREFDETGVEGINAALGEVFEKAAEGDEVVGLGDDLEIFATTVGFAVEAEAVFTKEFLVDVSRL